MPGFDMTITGEKEAARRIMAMGERGMNMQPIFEVLSDDWDDIVTEHFESQGRRGGRPWKGLSDSRKAYKARHSLDPRIMYATHTLINSLTKRSAKGSIRKITSDSMLRGTRIHYGEYHHYGIEQPERRLFVFTNRDRSAWAEVVQDYIISGAVRSPARWGGF